MLEGGENHVPSLSEERRIGHGLRSSWEASKLIWYFCAALLVRAKELHYGYCREQAGKTDLLTYCMHPRSMESMNV